jgi:hypothetical protein
MSDDANVSHPAEEESILECETCMPPADAFAIVGNETRLRILEALWEADRPAAFSDLRRSVGMRDSAQFNYHLSKLRDQFVRKTDDGYEFQQAGKAIVRAVLAGTYNQNPELEPFPVEGDCVVCGGELNARYEDEVFYIMCSDCERPHGTHTFPPGGLEDRTREEVLAAFNQRARHLSCLCADGVCPECNGRVRTEIEPWEEMTEQELVVLHECDRCGKDIPSTAGLALLDDAEIVSFYRDHGVDLNTVPFWTLEWCTSDHHTEVLSRDPWRLRLTIPVGEEALRVTVDGDLTVLETERRPLAAVEGAADGEAAQPPAGTAAEPDGGREPVESEPDREVP